MFVVFLLTAAFQVVIVLEAGELMREKRALGFIRLLYSLLAVISAALSLELLLAMASVEGGIYFEISALPRYVSILPALLFLYVVKSPVEIPLHLRPMNASFFIPLLLLPPADLLPMPLPVAFAAFAAAWFAMDTVRMLLSFRFSVRTDITRSVMPHIIQNIGHGICVANRSGWILEGNPAFYNHCESLGIQKNERIDEFETALKELQDAGRLEINDLENGRAIRTGSGVYSLQRSSFKAGGRTYVQLSFSDVTKITLAATELEQENEKLEQKNRELEKALADIELEGIVREREKLCRTAHDIWSQRLAVAGLSIDILLDQKGTRINSGNLQEIASTLEAPIMAESWQSVGDVSAMLRTLDDTYRKLGVKIEVHGRATFPLHQQQVLCDVLREALANAVRHAYARHISVTFFEDDEKANVTIQNICLDGNTSVAEGRGLHDMKTRVQNAGGSLRYEKSNLFELQVTFPKEELDETTGGG